MDLLFLVERVTFSKGFAFFLIYGRFNRKMIAL